MSTAELPPLDLARWTIRHKAAIVAAVQSGQIALADVCARYGLSTDEFELWRTAIEAHGAKALRVTKLQNYRG